MKVLNVFDFDDTLFRIPTHTSAKTWDLRSIHNWYDHPESLNDEKYYVQSIDPIASIARQADADPKFVNILITKRIPEMEPEIQRLLRKHSIPIDSIFAIGHGGSKPETLKKFMLESNSNFERIKIFEDCLTQMQDYKENFLPEANVEYYFVDKTHVIRLHSFDAYILEKIKLNTIE